MKKFKSHYHSSVIDSTATVPMVLYRFGFNGKEKDNDVYGNGNAMDFGARIYDPRVGRWMSVDPLYIEYLFLSPYQLVNNNPNWAKDPNGKEIWIVNKAEINGKIVVLQKVQYKNGQLYNEDGTICEKPTIYAYTVQKQLNQLCEDGGTPKQIVLKLESNKFQNEITNVDVDAKGTYNQTRRKFSWSNIFNVGNDAVTQFKAYSTNDEKIEMGKNAKRNPRVALAHELKHILQINEGLDNIKTYIVKLSNGLYDKKSEQEARKVENEVREKTGDPKVAE